MSNRPGYSNLQVWSVTLPLESPIGDFKKVGLKDIGHAACSLVSTPQKHVEDPNEKDNVKDDNLPLDEDCTVDEDPMLDKVDAETNDSAEKISHWTRMMWWTMISHQGQ